MPTEIGVAIIGSLGLIATAWIGRPIRQERRRLARIEAHTEKTGNGFAGHVLEGIDDIKNELRGQGLRLGRLEGAFVQHIAENTKEKQP